MSISGFRDVQIPEILRKVNPRAVITEAAVSCIFVNRASARPGAGVATVG
jgi:hypothetical protein